MENRSRFSKPGAGSVCCLEFTAREHNLECGDTYASSTGKATQYPRDHGRRHWHVEHRRLSPGHRPAAGLAGRKTHPDVPYITNLRLDPFERTGWPNNGTKDGAQQYFDWFKYQFWRFVFVQQLMAKELQTFVEYPPMQRGASFNLDAVKAEMAKRIAETAEAAKGPSN